jgi:succinoglycan biosynthesis transport protein ExoP
MESSGFPIEKTNRDLAELCDMAKQRHVADLYVESPRAEVAAAPGGYSFLDYWHILVRYRVAVLRFALAGFVAAILFSLAQTPLYRARTSLEVQDFNDDFLNMKSVDPTSTGNYLTAQSYFQTQIKMLQSESLLERVIDKLNLQRAQQGSGWWAFASHMRRLFESSNSSRLPGKEALIQQAKDNLTVRAAGETRLLEVEYESPDPKLAADFANTLVSEYIEQSQEMRWESTQRTAEWLTSHLDEMKAKLEQSEAQLQDYARTSDLMVTSEKDNVAEIRLKELQEELSKAQADRVAKQAKLEEAKSKPADSLPEMLEDPTLREYHVKLTDLQRQLAELSATLTPAHYKVQRVRAQIAELQSAIQIERGNILRRIGNEYSAALRRERLLAEAHAAQEEIVADQSGKVIHYNTLKREVDSSRQLYESMLQRVKQASLAAAMRASNVLVVDPAKPPFLPYRPRLLMNSALGLFSGVFLGLGFVLLRERLDQTIRVPGDALAYLNLPELGVIPLAELPATQQISKGFYARRALPPPSQRDQVSSPDDCPELATWQRKPSLLAECVRTALVSILLPGQNGDHPRVVVLTSPCPGDGKTTVASNLSIAMAEIRQKVVLIDGDLRRPRLHKVFGISNDWGLSDVLWAGTTLETIPIANLVCKTKVSGLYVLAGGRGAITTSTLLYSARMTGLLDRLRSEFDMVLIDAPPVIHLADARVLGRLADGVILVIRAGQTTSESALFASQRFAEDGTRVLGTILNSWDPKTSRRYGYGSYADYRTYVGQ